MEFLHPNYLWLATIVVPLAAYYIFIGRHQATLDVTTLGHRRVPRTLRYWLRPLPTMLRMAAIVMLAIALARPVETLRNKEVSEEGIDIVLSIDVSTSMMARDFSPNRLEAAKKMASKFVADRATDNFAVVAFAGESVSRTSLTMDRNHVQTKIAELEPVLSDNYRRVKIDDGTAIGDGLATALNRLRGSNTESKVVVLLTDGVNNSGQISPMMAAEIARDMGVKVYTIGVGSEGMAPYPTYDVFGNYQEVNVQVEIDEKLLRDMATMTGGQYFRATDEEALAHIYEQINQLEKSELQVAEVYHHEELFAKWLWIALLLLAVEFIFSRVILNRLP